MQQTNTKEMLEQAQLTGKNDPLGIMQEAKVSSH